MNDATIAALAGPLDDGRPYDDRRRDADGNALCARCGIRLLRVEDWTGDLCHHCRKED